MYQVTCPVCGESSESEGDTSPIPVYECPHCDEVSLWYECEVVDLDDQEETLDLGACCACGKEDQSVRNACMLHFKAPVPGTGWGCVVCNLPMDGAIAVLCDDCITQGKPDIKFAVKGFAADKQRIPFAELTEPFDHLAANHEAYEMLQ